MKKIEATIKSDKLKPVLSTLNVAGFNKLTYFEVKGLNQNQGVKKMWRGQEYREIVGTFIQIMLIVQNTDAFNAINIIKTISHDENSNTIICVTEIDELIESISNKNKVELLVSKHEEVI